MKNIKRLGIPLAALAISLGIVTVGHAQTPEHFPSEKFQIEVASTEAATKNEVIKKFKELFPNKFDFLATNDFHLSTGHYYPNDESIRYDLSFSKNYQGKEIFGNVIFAGEELKLESFYFEPTDQADALFPAKVSKDEAQAIAQDYIEKFANGEQYELEKYNNEYNYYSNQLLTEPIRYHFSFIRSENNIEITDQRMEVAVLGNGEVVHFYRYSDSPGASTFEEAKNVTNKQNALDKIKENLNLQLQYQITHDYRTDRRSAKLVYTPGIQVTGISAINEQWLTMNGFTETLPVNKEIAKITEQPLKPRQEALTIEEAKQLAIELLKIDSDEVKLIVEHVEERTNPDGREIISIYYMYDYGTGGTGASIEFDKATGEIVHYYNIKSDVLREIGEKPDNKTKISSGDALAKALDYLKEWVPSSLHNYIKPIAEPYTDDEFGAYSFAFPRIVNGLVVNGDDINVSIAFDGSLNSLSINSSGITDWPATEGILSKEEATKKFEESINVKLQYIKDISLLDSRHYSLLYVPVYNEQSSNILDAATGHWISAVGREDYPIVSHDTAEEELNYLIQNNILEVKNGNFNADASVSKGEALEILLRSISYFYEGSYPQQEEAHQSFKNIGPDHEYYQAVERAVGMGILDTKNAEFNASADMTREELAVWYIRVLGLEQAAKYHDIYKLDVKDAKEITHKGYAALVNALDILPAEQGLFNPGKSVTYAELAKSTIRLAHKVYEKGNQRYYY